MIQAPTVEYPLWFKLVGLAVLPPIIACWFWIQVRGEALLIWRGRPSERTKDREKKEFWLLLAFLYVSGIAIYVFAALKGTL